MRYKFKTTSNKVLIKEFKNDKDLINHLLESSGVYEEMEEIEETKPERLKHHIFNDKSFANISASRTNDEYEILDTDDEKTRKYKKMMKQKQAEENNKKTEQLKRDIKSLGLSYIKTYGAWRDEGQPTYEESFLIPNISKEQALALGKKYKQYSVIHKDKNSDKAYMYITLDNDSFENVDMTFDVSKQKGVNTAIEPSQLKPYSGYSGLKRKGKGFNYSYYEKEKQD